MNPSLPMTWQRLLQQKRRCKKVWIKYLIHVRAMISQSASKRLSWYISQHLESLTRKAITVKGQRLQVVDMFIYFGSTLYRVVHVDDEVNASLPKLVQHLADYVKVYGIEVESKDWGGLQIHGAASTILRMPNLDSLPTACQKTEPLPYKLS